MRFFMLLCILLLALPVQARAQVVLDTGHSPSRQGATSAGGRGEFTFNQRLAGAVAAKLTGVGVKVQRSEGELSLRQRTQGVQPQELFVSIHHDSIQQAWIDTWQRERYAGFSVFYSNKNPQAQHSLLCARLVGRALAQAGQTPSLYHATPIPGENRPLVDRDHGVHRYDDLVVLKTSAAPAVLVEAGVIANPNEEARLLDPSTVDVLARAIAQGVLECLAYR